MNDCICCSQSLICFKDIPYSAASRGTYLQFVHHADKNNGEHISFLEQAALGHGVFVHLYANAPDNNQQPPLHVNT